eukprot:11720-Heterococcus_DN1.PRE.1
MSTSLTLTTELDSSWVTAMQCATLWQRSCAACQRSVCCSCVVLFSEAHLSVGCGANLVAAM